MDRIIADIRQSLRENTNEKMPPEMRAKAMEKEMKA